MSSPEDNDTPDPAAPTTPGAAQNFYNQENHGTESGQGTPHNSGDTTSPDGQDNGGTDFEDPDPPSDNATREQIASYNTKVVQYCEEMFQMFQTSSYKGENLWIEFTQTFRECTINCMTRTMIFNWIELLTSRDVYVRKGRGFPRIKALKDCLNEQEYVSITQRNETQTENANPNRNEQSNAQTSQSGSHVPNNDANNALQGRNSGSSEALPENNQGDVAAGSTARNPPDGDNRSSKAPSAKEDGDVNRLLQLYRSQQKFSGSFHEDFTARHKVFETMARMCKLSTKQMTEFLPVMLKDNAFDFYASMYTSSSSYEEMIDILLKKYTSTEQRGRVLLKWQSLRLSTAFKESPDKSQVEVFKDFSEELASMQRQLPLHYRNDDFLRDQLIIGTDVQRIQQSLRERVPKTPQEAENRISTFLSEQKGSAASITCADAGEEKAFYSLGNRYGGDAQSNARRSRPFRKPFNRKVSSNWIKGVKGCFVCGKNHRARTRHSPEEVRTAIERLKRNTPHAMITVEDLAFISESLNPSEDAEPELEQDAVFSEDDHNTDVDDEDGEGYIVEDEFNLNKSHESYLADNSFMHGRTYESDAKRNFSIMNRELAVGEQVIFKGLLIDTCANRRSVMCMAQYMAYCREFKIPANINRSNGRRIKGIGGKTSAIGTAIIPVPFHQLDLIIDVEFQIMPNDIPTLLSMKDMLDNDLDISIQDRVVKYKKLSHPLTLENYFLRHSWKSDDITFSLYTEVELRRLHRSFGHPSVSALSSLLKRARPDKMRPEVQKALADITRSCMTCAKHAGKPKRFKLTIGTDELRFNHRVAIDVMYLAGRPVLHAVDEATHFNSASFVKNQSSQEIWKTFLRCWSRLYLGPPDYLHVDQGTNFVSQEFKSNATAEGITISEAPIESPNTMSHVERYHHPLRIAFTKIRETLPRADTDADCLQMAVKAVNDTVGPEGLCPTLLVFGTIPRPARQSPAETQLARARAIDKASEAVHKEQSARRVAFGMKQSTSPVGKESSADLNDLPAGAPVLVYRNKSKTWEGPFPFIQISGETVVVQLPSGRKIFRSTVVKAVRKSQLDRVNRQTAETYSVIDAEKEGEALAEANHDISEEVICALFGATGAKVAPPKDSAKFREARMKELRGLQDRGTFEVVHISEVPQGVRVYGTRFIDTYKEMDEGTILKSRLVAQNYQDEGASSISTRAPTVGRMGQRLSVCLAACYPKYSAYLRDITQSYVQSTSKLERSVYLRPPPEMELKSDMVLKAVKPLYGIPESGLHWFLTYHGHHINSLSVKPTRADTCVMFRSKENSLDGMTMLQVDDSFGFGSNEYLREEKQFSQKFIGKPQKILSPGSKAMFNGLRINVQKDKSYTISQTAKLSEVQKAKSKEAYSRARAQMLYIACCTRPDLCAEVQLLSSGPAPPTDAELKRLNKLVDRCKETAHVGLHFKELDIETVRVVLLSDASFANAPGMKSQIGFVLALVDKNENANIIHYGSSRCKRVTRSVLAAEVHGLVYGFDNAFIARDMIQEILGRNIELHALVDSRTLFNILAKNSPTQEKRLQIDICSLKESYRNGEINSISWIPGKENVADGLTKGFVNDEHPLWNLMTTNKLCVNPRGWVLKSTAPDALNAKENSGSVDPPK